MTVAIFVPHERLEALAVAGEVELIGDELTVMNGHVRFRVAEALRIVREVATAGSSEQLVGTVQLRSYLVDELGAELLGNSLLLDDAAFDVVTGMSAVPLETSGAANSSGPSVRECWSRR